MAGLTVAVTGPTGEIGKAFMRALERSRDVERIEAMARRPFDPATHGWRKTTYRQGDILDRERVAELVKGADVVVHLAFVVLGAGRESHGVNVDGSRNVFEAAVTAGVERLVYASSVAAYGFPDVGTHLIGEATPATGLERHPYSAQKAEVEAVLADALTGGRTAAWVFRPCIVAGPDARLLIEEIPYVRWGEHLPGALRALFDQVPILKPVLPDPGVPFQLVHHDDVATAMRAGVLGRGEPGAYNLAGSGQITVADLAEALGYYTVPLPELAVDAAAEVVARMPFLPPEATWIEAVRRPVLMDTGKARRLLRWRPRHTARETLGAVVAAARADLSG
ncbi:MAG: NAD-dependent epimerase/dehydratase family protein [Solirubrobacteraceae bacterium]